MGYTSAAYPHKQGLSSSVPFLLGLSSVCVPFSFIGFIIIVSFQRALIKEFVNMPCLEHPHFITVEHCFLASLVSLLSDQLGLSGPSTKSVVI